MGCIINMEIVAAHAFFIGEISPLPLNLVNKSVSRETSMLAANRLTQKGNERISAVCRHFLCAMFHYREIVCCLPSFSRHMLVGLLHFGLRPVQRDRLRTRPLQCRQRQQNISLTCAHKAGLSFAKILNWDGQQRRLFYPSWTQSMARKTIKLMSRCPTFFWSGKLKDRQR